MMLSSVRIGFIGAGRMAQALISGMLKNNISPQQIIASAPHIKKLEAIKLKFNITITDNNQLACHADVLIISVKPDKVQLVLAEVLPTLKKTRPILLSVAAGVSIFCLEKWCAPISLPIIRAMPNTPVSIGYGACGLFSNSRVSLDQKNIVDCIFKASGVTQWVDKESLMDAVIAVSGSGPAYYFLFIEAMIQAGVELGLSEKTARELTVQTALGSAAMALNSKKDIMHLTQQVCSPGGTTERALTTFKKHNLKEIVEKAMQDAVQRAQEITVTLSQS